MEYFQNFLNFKRSLVVKTSWVDKFYYFFKFRVIYTFYSCNSAVSNRCHNFKTCLQISAILVFGSKLDLTSRKSVLAVEETTLNYI